MKRPTDKAKRSREINWTLFRLKGAALPSALQSLIPEVIPELDAFDKARQELIQAIKSKR